MEHNTIASLLAGASILMQLGNSLMTLKMKNAMLSAKDEIKEWAEQKFMPIARCDDRTEAHEHRVTRLERGLSR